MSVYLERLKETYELITSPDFKEKNWAKIYKISPEGFKAKVQGVKGIIAFNQMPWKYYRIAHWQLIAPYLIQKVYEAQLLSSDKDSMKLTLSVEAHSFTPKIYTRGQSYKCLVLEKESKHMLVEVGLDSSFKNGSQYGHVALFDFWETQEFRKTKIGDEITLTFLNHQTDGKLEMCQPAKYTHWYKHKPQKLVGSTIPVNVYKQDDKVTLKVYNHFNGILRIGPKMYNEAIVNELNNYKRNLQQGDVIQCLVHGVNPKTNEIFLRINTDLVALLESQIP
jgi:ribosomal protein S1